MFSQAHLASRLVHLEPQENWVTELNTLLFVFPQGGSGHYVSRSVTHRLSPGDVLILFPTLEDRVCADEGVKMAFSFFSVHPEFLFPLFGSGEIGLLQNVIESFKATRLLSSATGLAQQCHRLLAELPQHLNLNHRAQLLQMFAAILSEEFKAVQPHLPGFVRTEDHLTQVLEELSTDDLMSLPVGRLAARFGCSKRHLSRLFQRYFGFSVANLKKEMRLLKAVYLLRDPSVKIISVAEQCWFHNLGLFNTCFKHRFHITPSQLRRAIAESDNPAFRFTDYLPICPIRARGLCLHAGGRINPRTPKDGQPLRQGNRPVKVMITLSHPEPARRPPGVGCPPKVSVVHGSTRLQPPSV
jgi:AraC-like DNA-binding protein